MSEARNMQFLLTNDDGVDAPGLQALVEAVDGAGKSVVVAPCDARSGCGHSTTTDRPIRLQQLGEHRYVVDGTPADCVRVALHRFGHELDWVLAGINSGGNLGVDVYHSGTVAAVREAAIRGIPAIAVSHYRNRILTEEDWQRAAKWTRAVLDDLLGRPAGPGVFWNINLPALAPDADRPEIVFCPLDPSPLPLSYDGDGDMLLYNGVYAQRPRIPGADVEVCFGGKIAVTRISVMEPSC
jgi:5'-nucleotidase